MSNNPGTKQQKENTPPAEQIPSVSEQNEKKEITPSSEELSADALNEVAGGRAAGDKPVKYMEYKLKDVLISG